MRLASSQLADLFHGQFGGGIGGRTDGQRNEHLIRMQAGIAVAQMGHFEVLDGLDDHRRNQVDIVADTAELFQRVEQHRRRSAQ